MSQKYMIGLALLTTWHLDVKTHEGTYQEAVEMADGIDALGMLYRTETDIKWNQKRVLLSMLRPLEPDEADYEVVYRHTWVEQVTPRKDYA